MKIKVLPIISALFLVIVMAKILSPTNMRLVIGVSAAMFMSATVNLFRPVGHQQDKRHHR